MRKAALFALVACSPAVFGFTTIWQQEFLGSAVNPESGNTLRARAFFHHYSISTQSGTQRFLSIELSNEMTGVVSGGKIVNSDLLSSLFWTMGGTLTRHSASLGTGSSFVHEVSTWGPDIGGEWGYRSGLTYRSVTDVHGVSAVGLGTRQNPMFSKESRFNENSLNRQQPIGGKDFSLMPGFDGAEGELNKNLVNNTVPLIRNSARFEFQTSSQLTMPGRVWAQYGTDLKYTSILLTPTAQPPQGEPIPEPFTMALGAGALALAAARRRKKR